MKKTLLLLSLVFAIASLMCGKRLLAEDYYPMACEVYEVDWINDEGGFNRVGCYNTFEEATTKMKESTDYVVRHHASASSTKIIAMMSGTAYAFPERINSSTVRVYQHPTSRSSAYKETYVADEYEMIYEDTYSYDEDGIGMVHVYLNGFDGYTALEDVDLVPTKFLTKDISILLGESDISYPSEISMGQSYYWTQWNGNYHDLMLTYYYASPNGTGYAKRATLAIGPAFDWMEDNKRYYSKDGCNFYTDKEMKNYAGTGYNYYQFLPLRSKSLISAETLNEVVESRNKSALKGTGEIFLRAQNKYGINALLLYAMAIHESGYGTSYLALNKNNLFGWNAVDSSPIDSASTFDSIEQCIIEQAALNLRGYLDIKDWRFFGSHLGNKGSGFNVKYASDPYWGLKISAIAYQIDKLSRNNDGSLTDYNQYLLAKVDKFDAEIKAYDNSILYTTKYGKNYQKMFTVIVLDEIAMIQSTNAVENYKIKTDTVNGNKAPIYEYDFDSSIGYINSGEISFLNKKTTEITEMNGKISITDYKIEDNNLIVAGTGTIDNVVFNNPGAVKQTLILEDYVGTQYEYAAQVTAETYNINDGNEYINCGFKAVVPLEEMEGSYILKLKTEYNNYYTINTLRSSNKKYSQQTYGINDKYCILFTNQLYNYRFEINMFRSDTPYIVNKPSVRTSLFSFDRISLNESIIQIEGQAMIYYLDYSQPTDFQVYLRDDNGNINTIETQSVACPIDYSTILSLEDDSTYACFEASGEVQPGEYSILMDIKNEGYEDVLELTNRSGRNLPSSDWVSIWTDPMRNRIRVGR